MLQLKNVVKNYTVGGTDIKALRGVSVSFRDSEFVSVLGPSGCGKTTLLNIIGGLDRYTSGDLVINGRSTKEYKDADWDTYRNHSVGFVFQSYNLIPHQTVLSNIELALTLSGVGKSERRKRAAEALEKVGLKDQMKKKPNQMSGGQMQRVAIARALVNDPDILLADEPTGALDSETSVQVMGLLKEISRDRLVIMVTHNRELAEKYSTRIVSLLDGSVTGDTNPYTEENASVDLKNRVTESKKGKKSMSYFTAFSLSFNNLMTKRARTILTAFAGSIGIIGIALILALSTGIKQYIDDIQRDTLSSYPITVAEEESTIESLLSAAGQARGNVNEREPREDGAVYSNPQMYNMFNSIWATEKKQNDLESFKKYLDTQLADGDSELAKCVSSIQYQYNVPLNFYVTAPDGKYISCDIAGAFSSFGNSGGNTDGAMYGLISRQTTMIQLWRELMPGKTGELVSDAEKQQYELLYGEWPKSADEVVLILDKNNELSDLAFYALGLVETSEVNSIISAAASQKEIEIKDRSISYDEALEITFMVIPECDKYADSDGDGVWSYIGGDDARMELAVKNGREIKITGVVRMSEAGAGMVPAFGYTTALTEYLINETNNRDIIKAQLSDDNKNYDVLTGLPFVRDGEEPSNSEKADDIREYFASLTNEQKKEIYTKMLSAPPEGYVEKALEEAMANYDTREKMEQLAATAYGLSADEASEYLTAYSDEELRETIEKQMTSVIETKYAQDAEAQIKAVMATPTDAELEAGAQKILSQLTSLQAKIGYIAADWTQTTTMSAEAIGAYLMSLPGSELDATAKAVAIKAVADAYAEMATAYSETGYARIAALFDEKVGNEADLSVMAGYYDSYMPSGISGQTYREVLDTLGSVNLASPSALNIYAESFENKDAIGDLISEYNEGVDEDSKISYTDYVALLMSGITDIINAITYGLIIFVAVSLVVSSIMIGIITYISVLERTKEIGVLRAIGASKRDVSLVFNAETLIIGLTAGVMGIGLSLLLCIPINLIVHALTGIYTINAFLHPEACAVLVLISMVLTLISGLIPSGIAAKKDPVEALRTE